MRDLATGYGGDTVLSGVSLTLPAGAVVGIIGPNGGGKSTLLKAIAGVLPLRSGSVQLGGKPLKAQAARVAFVPQREEVRWDFPVSALDVVTMGRYRRRGWLRWPSSGDRAAAAAALAGLGLEGAGGRHISQFSGGQQQRIFLARALVQDPVLVLLDEPFTGIDATNRVVFHEAIQRFAEAGVPVLMATHDLDEVAQTCSHVVAVNRGVVAAGPVAETFTPAVLKEAFGGQIAVFA